MRLALLKGNRFAPWHLQAFKLLPQTEVVAFRADSEIRKIYEGQDDGSATFAVQPIYFDTQAGPALARQVEWGLLHDDGASVRLTRPGKYVADAVITAVL